MIKFYEDAWQVDKYDMILFINCLEEAQEIRITNKHWQMQSDCSYDIKESNWISIGQGQFQQA